MKRFYENTLISRAFSNALRVVALLCVLLGVSTSAMAALSIPGSFNSWNHTGAIIEDGNIHSYSVDLTAGQTYSFTINDGAKQDNRVEYGANNATMQRDNCTNWVLNTKSTICNIYADVSGTYVFHYIGWENNGPKISVTYPTSGGGDSGDSGDDSGSGDCNSIEIYCHYDGSDNHDMNLHMWNNGGSDYTTWPGPEAQGHEEVNGKWYAKWVYETENNDICVKFTNGASEGTYASASKCGLQHGNKYYFSLPNGWGDKEPTLDKTEAIECGGGGDTPSGNCRTLYLEPTNIWNNGGARFAAYFYGGGPAETWVDMVSSSCSGLWKVAVPNSAYTNVIFVRMNGATSENNWNNKWNQTVDLSLTHSNNLFTITNMGSGSELSSGTWSTNACADQAECSGTGDDDPLDECDVVEIWARGKGSYTDIYCNVTSATAQSIGIKSYNGNNYATWKVTTKTAIAVSFCAGDNHSYCTNTANMEPGNRYYCEFAAENWGSQDYTITVTEPLECAGVETQVLLSKQALVNKTTKKATLYGYLRSTACDNQIVEYGFYYCRVIDGEKCKPTANSYKLQVSPSEALARGQEFSAELDLEDGYSYYYKAYAKINDVDVLSNETRLISTDPCEQQVCCGTPIVYTINADPLFMANVCKLHFNSLQDAIDHLKNSAFRSDAYQYVEKVGSSYNLKQPVVMNVVYYDDTPLDITSAYIYRGTTNVGKRAGDAVPKNSNLIEDINRTATNAANTLTIKAGSKTAKPWIHHIVLRNSKNIVLDSLCIYSDPVLYDGKTIGDNALEMDINHADGSANWHELNTRSGEGIDAGQHFFSNANILVQNCMIGSDGFTGAHISSYDGVTFKNNDFEIVAGEGTDTDYGASFKLLYCKNVKFIENNFRGDHATLMWIQEVQNMLVMNNVFWNTNKFVVGAGKQYPAAMRLATLFSNPIKNVGFFYNTYYFAENDITSSVSGYDFLQMTHTRDGGDGDINISTIKFQYNNCYSYDKDAPGRSADPFLSTDISSNSNFCPNNFWSQYDEDKGYNPSKFAFGCAQNEFTNVKSQVCETSASGPASLMIKGEDLNNGVKPDIAFTGITLTDEEWYSDRYLSAVRPKSNEDWTYGAYQSKGEIKTNTIYWVGVSDKWDDRNNWEYETRDASGKMIRQRVSCINNLSEDLKVVIEEVGTVEVAGGRKWPNVPASFNANDRKTESGVPVGEQVSAGLGSVTPTKFASTIELEYGAGLKGVENLQDAEGNMLYDNAVVHFDADRSKWLLVGNVIKPFKNGKDGEVRDVKSGDYYLDHLPQVYMHKAKVEGNTTSWEETFADLETSVPSNEVYAINVTGYYGTSWYPAAVYNRRYGTNYSATEAHKYTFNGRFAVAQDKATDEDYYNYALTSGKNLLNNIYPCNLNAKEIESLGLGTVNVYNYEEGAFESTSASQATGNVYIKAQNGFIFTPAQGKTTLELTSAILAEGSTRTRSNEIALPTFSLKVDNANTTSPGASNVVVRYDDLLASSEESVLNTPKVFTQNEDTPEAYIIYKDEQYSRLDTKAEKVCIPLGIRLQKGMNLTFEKVYNEGYEEVTLVDTKTQKYYNLLKRSYTTDVVEAGDTEGRFYLNLAVAAEEEKPEQGDDDEIEIPEGDNDVTTNVEEAVEDANINIYAVDGNIIRIIATGTTLRTIIVSDMTGRTDSYNVDGNFAELQLPVVQGVYTVNVIGDTANKTGKVILK